jgi:uncharacterized protein YdeI (YjbR/CyaY-like superfamily)
MSTSDAPIRAFASPREWEAWLKDNYTETGGIWLRLFKKATGKQTVTHDDALLVALCYGWIDGQVRPYDSESWIQKFTPRRKRSLWSKRNCDFVTQLIKEGKMQTSGLAEVEAAKADGRWDAAYDSPKNMVVPEDFLKELAKDPQALAFFETLSKTNKFAIGFQLQTAKKPETRERRKLKLLEMLKKGEKLY